jgi:hypothetical protein
MPSESCQTPATICLWNIVHVLVPTLVRWEQRNWRAQPGLADNYVDCQIQVEYVRLDESLSGAIRKTAP